MTVSMGPRPVSGRLGYDVVRRGGRLLGLLRRPAQVSTLDLAFDVSACSSPPLRCETHILPGDHQFHFCCVTHATQQHRNIVRAIRRGIPLSWLRLVVVSACDECERLYGDNVA